MRMKYPPLRVLGVLAVRVSSVNPHSSSAFGEGIDRLFI